MSIKTVAPRSILRALVCSALIAGTSAVQAVQAVQAPPVPPPAPGFAIVNGKPISMADYQSQIADVLRQRYYHGKVSEDQIEAARKEVTDLLIDRILLAEEAQRRGFKPDAAQIEQTLAGYETRYAASPAWQQQREQVLPGLRAKIAEQSVREQLEKAVRAVPAPSTQEATAFYRQRPQLFTEPEKLRLSSILLKVDPSAPKAVWDQTRERAQGLYRQIKGGADFAALARTHSDERSTGSLEATDYVHRGMLPPMLEEQIDTFKVGVVAEPITVLEGIALIRVDERLLPKLHAFAEVAQRARDLLQRERGEQASADLIKTLRAKAAIQIVAEAAPVQDASGVSPQQ